MAVVYTRRAIQAALARAGLSGAGRRRTGGVRLEQIVPGRRPAD